MCVSLKRITFPLRGSRLGLRNALRFRFAEADLAFETHYVSASRKPTWPSKRITFPLRGSRLGLRNALRFRFAEADPLRNPLVASFRNEIGSG